MHDARTYRIRYYAPTGDVIERMITPVKLVADRSGRPVGVQAICHDDGRRRSLFDFTGLFSMWDGAEIDDPVAECESLNLPVEIPRRARRTAATNLGF